MTSSITPPNPCSASQINPVRRQDAGPSSLDARSSKVALGELSLEAVSTENIPPLSSVYLSLHQGESGSPHRMSEINNPEKKAEQAKIKEAFQCLKDLFGIQAHPATYNIASQCLEVEINGKTEVYHLNCDGNKEVGSSGIKGIADLVRECGNNDSPNQEGIDRLYERFVTYHNSMERVVKGLGRDGLKFCDFARNKMTEGSGMSVLISIPFSKAVDKSLVKSYFPSSLKRKRGDSSADKIESARKQIKGAMDLKELMENTLRDRLLKKQTDISRLDKQKGSEKRLKLVKEIEAIQEHQEAFKMITQSDLSVYFMQMEATYFLNDKEPKQGKAIVKGKDPKEMKALQQEIERRHPDQKEGARRASYLPFLINEEHCLDFLQEVKGEFSGVSKQMQVLIKAIENQDETVELDGVKSLFPTQKPSPGIPNRRAVSH